MNESQKSKIEKWVSERQTQKAISAIYNENCEASETLEWLRRLGKYRNAFNLILRSLGVGNKSRSVLFDYARFLFLRGANDYARQIMRELPPKSAQELLFTAEFYLANFEHTQSRFYYEKYLATQVDPTSHSARLARLGLADSHAGLEEFQAAMDIAQSVYNASPEPLMQSIALSALGEYHARSGKFASGLENLNAAEALLPKLENLLDKALLYKWKGYCLAMLGSTNSGLKYLNLSRQIALDSNIRLEVVLDIERLRQNIEAKNSSYNLHTYPGLSAGFKSQLPSLDSETLLSKAPICIRLNSNEWRFQEKWILGLNLQLQLLAYLRLAGDLGIEKLRLVSLLYPDQAMNLEFSLKKFNQLLARMKKDFNFEVLQSDDRLLLGVSSREMVEVDCSENHRPIIFQNILAINTQAIRDFYKVSPAHARRIMSQWRKKALIPAESTRSGM